MYYLAVDFSQRLFPDDFCPVVCNKGSGIFGVLFMDALSLALFLAQVLGFFRISEIGKPLKRRGVQKALVFHYKACDKPFALEILKEFLYILFCVV